MTPAALAILEAEKRLAERAGALLARLDSGEDVPARTTSRVWAEYLSVITLLNAITPPERRAYLTTKQAAEALGVSKKVIRKHGAGRLGLEITRLGKRGTGAIRWRA